MKPNPTLRFDRALLLMERAQKYQNRFIHVDGFDVKIDSRRLQTFWTHGNTCYICGIEAPYFEVKPRNGGRFLELMIDVDNIMTSDHVVPLASGGADAVDNRRPCCDSCNHFKGSKPLHLTLKERLERKLPITQNQEQVALLHRLFYPSSP